MNVYDIQLQQQDHYKVLGLEKLRHKATLGDIKKACKFLILGCNSLNQIFMSHTLWSCKALSQGDLCDYTNA